MKTIFTFFIVLHSIVSYECGTKEQPDICTTTQLDTLRFDLNEIQAQEMIKDLQSAKDVRFHSGNFKGLTGTCTEVDFDSTYLYGVRLTFALSNGKTGVAYKGEHFKLTNS